jgi:flagellar motility protein MotE (MotC chaperone)
MIEAIDTKALKVLREDVLVSFLEQLKHKATWRQWLNTSDELHIAKVCRHLGEAEKKGKPWDSTCFRGANWAVQYKNDFNRWIKDTLAEELAVHDTDLFGNQLRNTVVLPPGLNFEGLKEEMVDFIKDKLSEVKRLKEKLAVLESQLNAKDRKLLELQTHMESVIEAEKAMDEHYLFSIRSLKYD